MPLVTSTPLFEHARKNRYAVPAFNANSYEMIPALIHAAEAERSPLIFADREKIFELRSRRRGGQLGAVPGKKSGGSRLRPPGSRGRSAVPGLPGKRFTSVMYDGSSLPDEENIRNTREVVQLAAQYGVPVEGEIGQVLQAEDVPEGEEPDFLTDRSRPCALCRKPGFPALPWRWEISTT